MNYFIVNKPDKEIWLDIPEPDLKEYPIGLNSYAHDLNTYNSRTHYKVSPELLELWSDQQKVEFNKDFMIDCEPGFECNCNNGDKCFKLTAIPLPSKEEKERMFTEVEMLSWAQWLCDSNWGEKETWGKRNPPSFPTMKQLLDIFTRTNNLLTPTPSQQREQDGWIDVKSADNVFEHESLMLSIKTGSHWYKHLMITEPEVFDMIIDSMEKYAKQFKNGNK